MLWSVPVPRIEAEFDFNTLTYVDVLNLGSVTTLDHGTYAGALSAAQQQAAGFSNEDSQLAAIETGNQNATAVLQAIQVNTEAELAVAQQIQLLRQLVVIQVTLEATKAGEELNERTQAQATAAKSANLGMDP